MTAELIDGRAVAKALKDDVAAEVEALTDRGVTCGLATVLVGDDYAARAYERRLRRVAGELGIDYRHYYLGPSTDLGAVVRVVRQLNADPAVHGVLVLRPLPPHVDEGAVFQALDPAKDVESVHPENAGLLALGTPRFVPSTPAAVFHVLDGWLDAAGVDIVDFYRRSTVVVVGRSNNVGKPAAALGVQRDAVVLTCDEWADRTGRLAELTRLADVLVVAAGVPGLIGADHVAPGALVLDVGINPVTDTESGRVHLVGDVDTAAVAHRARALTPVPGGIGPVTDVWLMRNTVAAARSTIGG
ncbi:bifunctional methylenetetrahydrofolate dehydrogenase/methenyltetrahydrofolate cyclohydrolase FolD [Pseudonocardia aurantiaca]|uniref:Bifunctional protein FolD n=1 Tax=Pseudonocardia aurantiaca TaxID=75290 RepID=A0ABW4FL38_9PSEU